MDVMNLLDREGVSFLETSVERPHGCTGIHAGKSSRCVVSRIWIVSGWEEPVKHKRGMAGKLPDFRPVLPAGVLGGERAGSNAHETVNMNELLILDTPDGAEAERVTKAV